MALRADDVDLGRDRDLVEEFQAGNAAAFDDLYRRYFQRLYRFCLKRVGDAHEAEELAQEAFTRAYLHLDALDGDRRFYPWMTVIAGRLCIDTHRRRARSEPSDNIDLGVVDGGQDAIIDQVDLATLEAALTGLAPRHREVLDLRERQGLSYQSIADHYGVTLGTVEALLWRARKALRREFLALTQGDLPGVTFGPVTGAGLSRLAGWRFRIGTWLQQHAQPLAAGAAAVVTAAAVGLAGGEVAGPAGPVPAIRVRATRPADGLAVGPAPALAGAVLPGVAPVGGAITTVGTATRRLDPYQGLRREVAQAQVHYTAGPIGVGANPTAVAKDLGTDAATTVHLLTSLLGGKP